MNFNTFFLDKLSSGDQSPILNSKKNSASAHLFSDIIKVCEQEAAPNINSEIVSLDLTSLAQGTFPLPENMVESDNLKLQTISKFIENFIANSNQPVNSSEIKHDLQPVVITKKQFILSSYGLEDFINGLAQSLGLIPNAELANSNTQKVENVGTEDSLKTSANNTENQKFVVDVKSGKEEKTSNAPQNIELMLQSLLNYLSNNRSLNLSFKNGTEKVSVNIYELPEINVETKINFEKLSADFEKAGSKLNYTLTNSLPETKKNVSDPSKVIKQNPAEYFLSQIVTNDPIVPVPTSSLTDQDLPIETVASGNFPNENVYKIETVEISLRAQNGTDNLNTNVASVDEKLIPGIITLPGFASNSQVDMSEVKFRIKNQQSAGLSSLESSNKKITATIPGADVNSVQQNTANPVTAESSDKNNLSAIQNTEPTPLQQNSPKPVTVESSDKNILAAILNSKEKIQSIEVPSSQQTSTQPVTVKSSDENILTATLNSKEKIQSIEVPSSQQTSPKPVTVKSSDENILAAILNSKEKIKSIETPSSKETSPKPVTVKSSDKNILTTILNSKEKIQLTGTTNSQQKSAKPVTAESFDKNILATAQNLKEKIQNTDTLLTKQNSEKSVTSEPLDKNILATILNSKEKIQSANFSFTQKFNSFIKPDDANNNKNRNSEVITGNIKTTENNESPGKNIFRSENLNADDSQVKNISSELPNAKVSVANNSSLFTQNSSSTVKVNAGEKIKQPGLEGTVKQNIETESNAAFKSKSNQADNQPSDKNVDGDIKLSSNSAPEAVSKSFDKQGDGNDARVLLNELSGKFASVEIKKSLMKDENTKTAKDEDIKTLKSNENIKDEKASAKEAQSKSSDEKDSSKHRSNENFKNILQVTDQISGNEADKFKITAEVKLPQETIKVIKTPEIIPEFSKIIQAGEKQSVTFQLTPENLGKVKLVIDLVENQINTRIEVENEQVKQYVQSNIEQLKQNLQTSGIQLNNVSISLAESEQKFSRAFTPRKKSGERISKIKAGEERIRPSQKSLGYNTYEFLA